MLEPLPRIAAVAGFLTWLFLNRCRVHGDYALAAFISACAGLYYHVRSKAAEVALQLTLSTIGSYVLCLGVATIAYRLSPFHPLAKYPGPLLWRISSLPLVFTSLGGRRHLVVDALHKKHGPLVRIGPNMLSVNSYSAYNTIYGNALHMAKSDYYRVPGHIKAVALFFQQSREDHAIRKQMWQKALTPSAILNYTSALERRTWQLTERIEIRSDSDGVVDIAECLTHWSYDFMGDVVFGGSTALDLMKDGDPRGLISGGKRATAVHDSFAQAPWLFDILWHIPAGRSMHYLRNIAASMMRTRVQSSCVKIRDLTSYLLDGHPRTGRQVPLSDLEVDAVVAIQGGSDGTGTVMALLIYYMLSRPSTYKSLRTALDEACSDPCAPLENTALCSIPLLDAVLNEVLRLGPTVFMPRVVPQSGAIIEDAVVPGGTEVVLAMYSQHTAEENFFPDPHDFLPERWLPGGLGPGSITNRAALSSFSTGPDVCIGKNLAMQEMRACLARLVLTFDLWECGHQVAGNDS